MIMLSLLLSITFSLLSQNNDAKEIMRRSQQVTRLAGLETQTTLEIRDDKGNVRTRKTLMASRLFQDGTEKRVILFKEPAEVRGTGILIFDHPDKEDDMWLYLPALRKTRKIVSTEKSRSFMGSEFSNSDLSVASLDPFQYRLEGEETMDGEACWKILITPVNSEVRSEYGFAEKLIWISKNDLVTRRAELKDVNMKPWKEVSYGGIKLVDPANGRYFITRMEIINLQNRRSSLMTIEEVDFNPAVNPEYFTLSFIESQ